MVFHIEWVPSYHQRQAEVPLNLAKVITFRGPLRAGKTYPLYHITDKLHQLGVLLENKDFTQAD